jgi:hypothetical protein
VLRVSPIRLPSMARWPQHCPASRAWGAATVSTRLAELPEQGQLCRRRIAAQVGVAPLNRNSGQMRGQRLIWGGRADVQKTLYMATLVAVRHSPVFKIIYERLAAAGNPQEGRPRRGNAQAQRNRQIWKLAGSCSCRLTFKTAARRCLRGSAAKPACSQSKCGSAKLSLRRNFSMHL